MNLDSELAEQAMQPLADRLGMSVEEAALGALQIQKYGMTQAIELNSVRRGYDPREFVLVAAGGAGPLFACDIAMELEIARVLVPRYPGIVAATGLLATDLHHEFVATERHALADADLDRLRSRYRGPVGPGDSAARAGRRARGPPGGAAAGRLPLRRPGLRGPLRHSGRRDRRPLADRARRALPPGPRGRVRPPLRGRDRARQRPRGGDRRRSPTCRPSGWSAATAIRRAR